MTKSRVYTVLKDAFPLDLSISEISRQADISDITGAMYVRILEAERKVEHTRVIGRSKMFKFIEKNTET